PANYVGEFPMNKLKPTPRLQATIRNDGDAGAIFEIYSCRELTGQGIEGEIALFVISRRNSKRFCGSWRVAFVLLQSDGATLSRRCLHRQDSSRRETG